MYVLTWDLLKNIEFSLVQISSKIKHPEHLIFKGMKTKYNYYITTDNFYDFQYMLPFRFIKADDNYDIVTHGRNEIKLSKDKSVYLGQGF